MTFDLFESMVVEALATARKGTNGEGGQCDTAAGACTPCWRTLAARLRLFAKVADQMADGEAIRASEPAPVSLSQRAPKPAIRVRS